MQILQENETYRLELERLPTDSGLAWWVTLIHKPSGMAQTLIDHNGKQSALRMFDGMTLEAIAAFMDRAKVPAQKVYKAVKNAA